MKTYTVCTACGAVNGVLADKAGPKCGTCQAPLGAFHDGLSELNVAQLDGLVKGSPLPVVADFWAAWCGPCKAFAPAFRQASAELAGQWVFAKVDTEADPRAGQRFGIQAIPTLIAFHRGAELKRLSGALPLPQFKAWLDQSLRG